MTRGSEHFARTGHLHEYDQAQIFWVSAGLQFQLVVLDEGLSFFQFADFGEFLSDAYVREMLDAVFSVQDLRLGTIESDGGEDIGIVLVRGSVHVDMGAQEIAINAYRGNAHERLRGFDSLQNKLAEQL